MMCLLLVTLMTNQAVFPRWSWVSSVFFLHLFQTRTFGISGTGFCMGWMSFQQQCQSTEGNKRTDPSLSGLASSFHHPPADLWRKGLISLYAIFQHQYTNE